jgi:hypothetical protein
MGKHSGVVIIIVSAAIVVVIYTMTPAFRDQTKNSPTLKQVRNNFTKLNTKFGKIPLRMGDSAFTENKEIITLCLTDPDTKADYDINTIMYVALHELAHVITPEGEEEHGTEFKKNFSKLLKEASDKGIYNPRIPIPATYCRVGTR